MVNQILILKFEFTFFKEHIEKAISENPVAILSTHNGGEITAFHANGVVGEQIESRPMMILHDASKLGFYFVTHKGTKKLAQIRENADVSVLMGKTDGTGEGYLDVLPLFLLIFNKHARLLVVVLFWMMPIQNALLGKKACKM